MKIEKQKKLNRGAGVLLPIASLPSNYGIGTFGKDAYSFVDFIGEAGLKYWQVLPIGPTGYGDSPYQSFSAFAGNPYFVDLDILIDEGLISKEEVLATEWYEKEDCVDYEKLYKNRFNILKKAYQRSRHKKAKGFLEFCDENSFWLEDYALFMAIKGKYSNLEWMKWPERIRLRKNDSIENHKTEMKDEVEFWKFIQYKFMEQWLKLKKYASEKRIFIIGDIPMYIALDSTDAWINYKQLHIDETHCPTVVAGVPPDFFSDEGQLWGNPLYDWEKMEKDDYSWWRKRIRHSARIFDIIRIDHFLGVANYYCIPFGEESAKSGTYRKGPGIKLIKAIGDELGAAKIVAEDLGVENGDIKKILEKSGYPGMKVLLFAFDGNPKNPNLPKLIKENEVAYGGTHDNDTLLGYLEGDKEETISLIKKYFSEQDNIKLVEKIIETGFNTKASVVIFQMQDYLVLGNHSRINEPATLGENWKWRLKKEQINLELIEKIKKLKGKR